MILIDTREKKWPVMFQYAREFGITCRRETIHNGADFLLGLDDDWDPDGPISTDQNALAIQRKERNDFAGKGKLGKLKDDLDDAREHYSLSALLVEGHWDQMGDTIVIKRGKKTPVMPVSQWHNFIWSQQMRGTMYMHTSCLEETMLMLRYAQRWFKGDMTPPRATVAEPHLFLRQLPGIGPTIAKRLVEEYGNVALALSHLEEWEEVDGIGLKTHGDLMNFLEGR